MWDKQAGGCEAAIHAMRDVFEDEETECVLLMDAANAFNSINRNLMLENIRRLCPIAYIYAYNCYAVHARLFVVGGIELTSREGTTQGDPPAMTFYGLGILPFLRKLQNLTRKETKQAGFADDLQTGGKVANAKIWLDTTNSEGPKYGWNGEHTKSHLVVKPGFMEEALNTFEGTGVNVNGKGRKNLGASIGSNEHKEEFVEEKVEEWIAQIETLAEIAKIDPHSAYISFTAAIRHRYTFCMRTIPDISHLFEELEKIIRTKLIPSLTEGRQVTDDERDLLALPPRMGGMGIVNPTTICDLEYDLSKIATSKLATAIKNQQVELPENFESLVNEDKLEVKRQRAAFYKEQLDDLKEKASPESRRSMEVSMEKGASNWLTALPLTDHDYHLTKREFWDAVKLRYSWPLTNLPSRCVCGDQFSVEHGLKCLKGGFITQRHNELRDLTGDLLSEICKDVTLEPPLEPLTGELLKYKTAKAEDDAHPDVSARGFWVRGQRAFFDIKVFSPSAPSYLNKSLQQSYLDNEGEKRRNYNQRIMEVEHGSFTPLVFSCHGGMGHECAQFFRRLCGLIAEKRADNIATVTSAIRTRISFALLRSALVCIRGTRHRYHKWCLEEVDLESQKHQSGVRPM